MKFNPVNCSIPGAKCCVHKNGMTAVVSENDSVYLYTGRKGEPLRMLAFNSKSGEVLYVDEKGRDYRCSTEELEQFAGPKEIYGHGLQILETAQHLPLQSEEKKVGGWMQNVLKRPSIELEELKAGHCLVAEIDYYFNAMLIGCKVLGDSIDRNDGKGTLFFRVEQDPDLGYGVLVSKKDNQGIHICPSLLTECGLSGHSFTNKVRRLTREDARWLRELLPPHPVQRYLNIHKEMLDAAEAKKNERGKTILRSVSRTRGKTDPFGTVAI